MWEEKHLRLLGVVLQKIIMNKRFELTLIES